MIDKRVPLTGLHRQFCVLANSAKRCHHINDEVDVLFRSLEQLPQLIAEYNCYRDGYRILEIFDFESYMGSQYTYDVEKCDGTIRRICFLGRIYIGTIMLIEKANIVQYKNEIPFQYKQQANDLIVIANEVLNCYNDDGDADMDIVYAEFKKYWDITAHAPLVWELLLGYIICKSLSFDVNNEYLNERYDDETCKLLDMMIKHMEKNKDVTQRKIRGYI